MCTLRTLAWMGHRIIRCSCTMYTPTPTPSCVLFPTLLYNLFSFSHLSKCFGCTDIVFFFCISFNLPVATHMDLKKCGYTSYTSKISSIFLLNLGTGARRYISTLLHIFSLCHNHSFSSLCRSDLSVCIIFQSAAVY